MITCSVLFPEHLHHLDLVTHESLNLRLQSLCHEVQLEVSEDNGELKIKLRGFGHKPICVNNQPITSFETVIPIQSPTHCEICGELNEHTGLRCLGCIDC